MLQKICTCRMNRETLPNPETFVGCLLMAFWLWCGVIFGFNRYPFELFDIEKVTNKILANVLGKAFCKPGRENPATYSLKVLFVNALSVYSDTNRSL